MLYSAVGPKQIYIERSKIMRKKFNQFGTASDAVPRVTVNSEASGQTSMNNQKQKDRKGGDEYGRI